MPSPTDPAMLLLYGLDESGLTSVRVNSGYLGTAQDLSVYQSSGTDGIVPVDDSRGGKAAWFDVSYPSPYTAMTAATRMLRAAAATGSAHTCKPALPLTSANDDWGFGCRFKWIGGETDGGAATEVQFIFGLKDYSANLILWGIGIVPNAATNPATGATLRLMVGGKQVTVTGGSYTTTGSPPTDYVLPDEWYRVLVRVYNVDSTHWLAKIYLYRESTGVTYTFVYNAGNYVASDDYSGAMLAATGVRVEFAGGISSANPMGIYGYVDEAWLYDAAISDGDATVAVVGGFQVPWSEPSYRVADQDVRVTYAEARTDFPPSRALPIGGDGRHTVGVFCDRFKLKYESFRPGRPAAIREVWAQFDSVGPYSGKRGNLAPYEPIVGGLVRLPGKLDTGICTDVRNFEFSGRGPRRRRGFRIRRNVSTEVNYSANAFFSWRDSSDILYRCYKAGTKLFAETGSGASQIDTGWSTSDSPVGAVLDNRLVLCSASRRKSWRGSNSAVESFGAPAAPTAPTAATTAGTLTGTYYYAYTEYDPTTGDESAAGFLVSAITPAAQGVTLTLAAVSSDARFSQRRIYRTAAGGAAPLLYRIATVATATSYTDGGVADGTVLLGSVLDSNNVLIEYITGTPPQNFIGCAVHLNRMFYWYGNTVYWTKEYEPFRWGANGNTGSMSVTCDGPVRAVFSDGYRLVILTRSTVEIIESDFIPDGSGFCQMRRSVVERKVGCLGPHSPVQHNNQWYWMDWRGVYTLIGDKVLKISEKIDNLFKYLNVGYAASMSGAYNHLRNQLWWACPFGSIQDDNTRSQTIVALHPGEDPRWTIHELEASFIGQFDDDLNGVRFGAIDHLGVFKELETYEGDGAEGNESTTTEDDDGISSISGSVVTVSPSPGWTTDEHRGKGVVLRDASTGVLYYYTIANNGAATFTVVGTPATALAALDGYYVGGMRGYVEIAEQTFGTANHKVVRSLMTHFDDLAAGRFV